MRSNALEVDVAAESGGMVLLLLLESSRARWEEEVQGARWEEEGLAVAIALSLQH